MSRSVRIWLLTAAALTVLGLVLFAGGMQGFHSDFSKLSTEKFETNTYEVSGDFDRISIQVNTTEIALMPSDDEGCRIVCLETEKVKHSAAMQHGTLVIDTVDTRKWYDHIGIFFENPKMLVYLPKDAYAALCIVTDTGDIEIPAGFSFETIEIAGSTADIICHASASTLMKISTDTGDVQVQSLTSEGNVNLETDTGDIELTNVNGKNIFVESDTGDIAIRHVVAESFFIQSDTGDVRLKSSDAAQISVKTSTGDVTGTLLSAKEFIVGTETGSISVPKNAAGGRCEIMTSTGDIEIDLQ